MSKSITILAAMVLLGVLTFAWFGRSLQWPHSLLNRGVSQTDNTLDDAAPPTNQPFTSLTSQQSTPSASKSASKLLEYQSKVIETVHLAATHQSIERRESQRLKPKQQTRLSAAVARQFLQTSIPISFAELSPSQPSSANVYRLPPLLGADQEAEAAKSSRQPQQDFIIEGPTIDDPTEDRDVVLFAAGSVELRPPKGWSVREIPYGREVRLALSPQASQLTSHMPDDGFWLTYHPYSTTMDMELDEMMISRLALATDNSALATDNSALATPIALNVAGWEASMVEFTIPSTESDEQDTSPERKGRHLLIRTDWGVLELHATSSSQQWPQRDEQFTTMMADLKLSPPTTNRREIVNSVRDAQTIIGSWRSYRSYLKLRGDGRISILIDPPTTQLLDSPRDAHRRPDRLTGSYEAHDDLLRIVWDDGSKLNYRWRLNRGELMMTDHRGQISQLRPVLE